MKPKKSNTPSIVIAMMPSKMGMGKNHMMEDDDMEEEMAQKPMKKPSKGGGKKGGGRGC